MFNDTPQENAGPAAYPPHQVPVAAPPELRADPEASSRWKSAARWCSARGRDLAAIARKGVRVASKAIFQFVADVNRYYWSVRGPLAAYVTGFSPNLLSESVRQREVRLAADESHAQAEFGPDGWKVTLPDRCVVCGEPAPDRRVDEAVMVDDAARAFWAPVGTVLAGIALSLIEWDRRLILPAIPLGIVLGYLVRGKKAVRLRLVRCEKHATSVHLPQVMVWGNRLVLRFGHKIVRKVFVYGEPMTPAIPTALPPAVDFRPDEFAPPRSAPETIPLADSPPPESSQIKHDLPPVFGPDGGPNS